MLSFRLVFNLPQVSNYLIQGGTIKLSTKKRQHDSISFNENQFSFLVADHLLVGQLCTNPKSERRLLSCLKVTQCSTSEIGDAPLYNACSQPIQLMTTGPLPAPLLDCYELQGHTQGDENKVSSYGYGLWCGFK